MRRWLLAFSLVAFALSVFLLWKETLGGSLPGCDGVVSCNVVLASRWSRWAGLPIASLGTGCYCVLSLLLVGWERSRSLITRHHLWRLMIMQSITGIGFVSWLTFLQAFVVHHFCLYCMTAHFAGLIAFVLVFAGARRAAGCHPFAWRQTLPALLVLGLLVGVHVSAAVEPAHVEADSVDSLTLAKGAVSSSPGIRIGKPVTSRTVTLLDGNLTFDLSKVPVVGDPTADLVALDLFDYQCPSCRTLHKRMHEYAAERSLNLALIVLPVPMEAACNPNLKH
ncbi:MAG: hypothetical protein KDL10_11670, partial [Kiritimatiellae bacterium]|nr:hypothetical protein [Kiritimatiellia bacterium]